MASLIICIIVIILTEKFEDETHVAPVVEPAGHLCAEAGDDDHDDDDDYDDLCPEANHIQENYLNNDINFWQQ